MASRNFQTGVAVAVAIAVIALFFVYGNIFSMVDTSQTGAAAGAEPQGQGMPQPTANDLVVQDQVVGTGAEAALGKMVTVNYTGRFQDGSIFDSSVGKQPFSFQLGAGMVIAGWEQGVQGMKVGGKRILIVPPQLGYGPNDYGPIPGGSTLIFEVELLNVQ